MTLVQRHALAGASLVALFLAGVTLPHGGLAYLGDAAEAQVLGYLLAGAAVGALVGLAEWVAQIASLSALTSIRRGEISDPADEVDE